jgi:hypothetical protein
MPDDTIQDDLFGELCYDEPMQEWYGQVALTPKHQVEVAIWYDEDDGPFAPVLERARSAYQRLREREWEHRQALAVALVKRYGAGTPKTKPLPGVEKVARGLSLSQITFDADGSAMLYYDDAAKLFPDHAIFADLDAGGAFLGFTLQG